MVLWSLTLRRGPTRNTAPKGPKISRVSYSGSTRACQVREMGSIPIIRSKIWWYYFGMKDTTGVGSITEGMVLAALLQKGKQVYIPFSGNSRCDLLVDEGDHISRVQCKTGRIRRGCVVFRNYSMTGTGLRPYRKTEVDFFGVYCPDNRKVYMVPIEACAEQITSLRVEPMKGKSRGKAIVRPAQDFEV